MFGSLVVYLGLVIAFAGTILLVKPIQRLGVKTRPRALVILSTGISLAGIGMVLPVGESRVGRSESQLDRFVPVWHFNERHSISIAAPPDRVFNAIREVRADEIPLFHALTWIRRGGKDAPESILNPGSEKPILDVALNSGFYLLADDEPREVVIGTIVLAPPGREIVRSAELFQSALPPGMAIAVMNFMVRLDEANRSIVTTETRVFASSPSAKRQFRNYWRLIYPGSALIRRMWLRAIRKRAEAEATPIPPA